MSILIKGMDMPEHCIVINIYADGRVTDHFDKFQKTIGTAVPVPTPHGRLIDAGCDTFPTPHRNPSNDYMIGWNACLKSVQQQPTIIEAEGEDNG